MKNINKSTNKQIKIGIVGYGIRGQKMARLSINNFPEYEITAVCDKSKEMLIKAEQDFPEIKTYHNFDKIIPGSIPYLLKLRLPIMPILVLKL